MVDHIHNRRASRHSHFFCFLLFLSVPPAIIQTRHTNVHMVMVSGSMPLFVVLSCMLCALGYIQRRDAEDPKKSLETQQRGQTPKKSLPWRAVAWEKVERQRRKSNKTSRKKSQICLLHGFYSLLITLQAVRRRNRVNLPTDRHSILTLYKTSATQSSLLLPLVARADGRRRRVLIAPAQRRRLAAAATAAAAAAAAGSLFQRLLQCGDAVVEDQHHVLELLGGACVLTDPVSRKAFITHARSITTRPFLLTRVSSICTSSPACVPSPATAAAAAPAIPGPPWRTKGAGGLKCSGSSRAWS